MGCSTRTAYRSVLSYGSQPDSRIFPRLPGASLRMRMTLTTWGAELATSPHVWESPTARYADTSVRPPFRRTFYRSVECWDSRCMRHGGWTGAWWTTPPASDSLTTEALPAGSSATSADHPGSSGAS